MFNTYYLRHVKHEFLQNYTRFEAVNTGTSNRLPHKRSVSVFNTSALVVVPLNYKS